MGRSQSFLKSLVAITLLTSGLLGAGAALAQRAITNSNSGSDPTLERRGGTALVGCNTSNTFTQIGGLTAGGSADICAVAAAAESVAAASSVVASYGGSSTYTLTLSNSAPERANANGLSSGSPAPGLFALEGFGQGAVDLVFQRQQAGDFLMAFSGTFGAPGAPGQDWAAYYLFDDVQVDAYENLNGVIKGQMNFELFQRGRFLQFVDGVLVDRPTRDYTAGLVVSQVSIYTLDRQARTYDVPASGSITLAGLGLALLAALRRPRRGTRA